MSRALSPWGYLPDGWRLSTIKEEMVEVTDYVANGSFASLAENVQYKQEEDYAVLIRLVDYNNGFKDGFVYIDEHAYNFLGKSKLFGGEIIISNVGANVGTVFKAPYLKKPMSLAPNAICVKLKGNNDFYYYWFKSRIGQYSIDSLVSGSAQPKFNKTHFKSMPIPVPPIHEQDEIASILSSLDDKIEVNKKICENLEAQAQALFKHWFVDFAPFKDGKFVESELGLIPEGWRVGTIQDLASKMASGGTPSSTNRDYYGGNILWFSTKELNDSFLLDSEKYITHLGLENSSAKLFPKNTILMAIYAAPTVGRLGILSQEATFNQAAVGIVAKEEIGYEYIYSLLLSERKNLNNLACGAAQQNLNVGIVKNYKCIIPSKTVLSSFRDYISQVFLQMKELQSESSRLATLRDTLLPKLMSGQIKL